MLRPYQQTAINEVREIFKSGKKRAMIWMATGAGKTVIFSEIIKNTRDRGRKAMVLVRGRKLVSQASHRLFRESITHGVMMAGHWAYKPTAPVQICSVDTLMARGWRPNADLIVIDEAHQAISEGYIEVLSHYPHAFIVAVTATPYSNKSMRHIADEIVHPITMQDLIEQGFLVKARYFAPTKPDMTGIRVSRQTGDYVQDQLADLMDKSSITGDIITHWKKLGENRPTICFAVSVEHSKHIASQFNDAGINAEHCDADTPEKERELIIKRLETGETKVVSNVGILCTGVDIPPVACIVMARPTKSYNLYVQQAGRGTRIHSGKNDFILLDHAGNVLRHGFITDEPIPNLDGKKFVSGNTGGIRTCEKCFAVVKEFPCTAQVFKKNDLGENQIETCGWKPHQDEDGGGGGPRKIIHVPGELTELVAPSPLEKYECDRFCEEQIQNALDQGRNVWSAYYKTIEKFGEQAARLSFFRICKRHNIVLQRKKKDGYPFK